MSYEETIEELGFPKVLVISVDPFNKNNGTGITLSNLFEGWDKNKLAQIYISDNIVPNDICVNYFHLNPKDAFLDYYLRRPISYLGKGEKKMNLSVGGSVGTRNRGLKNKIHLNSRAVADFSPILIPLRLHKWVKLFDPDIIYCMLGNVRMINVAKAIALSVGKPIVPHFMDDWPATLYTGNELFGLARYLLRRKLNKLFSLSNGGICISDLMAKEYKTRYRLPFVVFGNSVDESHFCSPQDKNEGSTVFMYVGGLHLNRWTSLLDVSEAIETVNKGKRKILLKIYAPIRDIENYSKYFKRFPSTYFMGSIKSEEVFSTLNNADILIHVESFDEHCANYTKYSLSTKIPQYMAAGKPILAYGPSGLASIEHIRQLGAGVAVCENSSPDLKQVISTLTSNQELLFSYANNGFKYAKDNYSKTNNLIRLANALRQFS